MPTHDRHAPCPAIDATALRVLVADDDPGSCRFLCDAFQQLGAHVLTCSHGTETWRRACDETFDVLLLDCRMPGAGALEILARLHDDPQARSATAFAIATSAEITPDDHQQLLAGGFSAVLLKPCTMADLQRILPLVPAGRGEAVLLDDAVAMTNSGNADTMRALRFLLRDELVLLQQDMDLLVADSHCFNERLHRLRSSCGFCGAGALSVQVIFMQRQLATRGPTPASLGRLRAAIIATLDALSD